MLNGSDQRLKITDAVYFGYLLLAVALPFGGTFYGGMALSWSLVIGLVLWIVNWDWRSKLMRLKMNRWFIGFATLYALVCIGVLYSSNTNEAQFKLTQKSALLLLPLMFATVPVATTSYRKLLLRVFVVALASSVLIDEIVACIRWTDSHDNGVWLYKEFSWFLHPTYFAVLLNIGLFVALRRCITSHAVVSRWLWFAGAMLFSCAAVQAGSRAGVLSLIIVWLVHVFLSARRIASENKTALRATFGLMAMTLAAVIYFSNNIRLSAVQHADVPSNISSQTTESAQIRVLVWREAWLLITERPFLGYGTGDANDKLVERYQRSGIASAYEMKLNAHNQYLQSWIANGLLAPLVLVVMLLIGMVRSYRKKLWTGLAFFAVIGFNFLFEAMLETREGLFTFAFFAAVFFSYMSAQEKSSSPK